MMRDWLCGKANDRVPLSEPGRRIFNARLLEALLDAVNQNRPLGLAVTSSKPESAPSAESTKWRLEVTYADETYVYRNPDIARILIFQGVSWAFTHISAPSLWPSNSRAMPARD